MSVFRSLISSNFHYPGKCDLWPVVVYTVRVAGNMKPSQKCNGSKLFRVLGAFGLLEVLTNVTVLHALCCLFETS
jgi:hypothetical protein